MTLGDIIKTAGDRRDWVQFDCGWTIDENGAIRLTMPDNLTLDTEVSVIYQWYHHLNPAVDTKAVFAVIENHNYAEFQRWYDGFGWEGLTYFPSAATMWVGHEPIGEVTVAYSPDMFNLITDQDYECG